MRADRITGKGTGQFIVGGNNILTPLNRRPSAEFMNITFNSNYKILRKNSKANLKIFHKYEIND